MSIEEFLTSTARQDEIDTIDRLQSELASRAEQAGVLDVSYRTVDTSLGELLLAATDRGLVKVAYLHQDEDAVLQGLSDQLSPRILRAPQRLDGVAAQLEEYLAGSRRAFEAPLDLSLARGFRRTVLEHLRDISYGSTASYAEVAVASGSPRAFRAVGTACALNPLPIVIPCHRVLPSNGTLGQYAGGVAVKATLLSLEAAA